MSALTTVPPLFAQTINIAFFRLSLLMCMGPGFHCLVHLISEQQVCHHEDCQEANGGHPLLLCLRCDEVQHLGAGSSHARFDVPGKVLTWSQCDKISVVIRTILTSSFPYFYLFLLVAALFLCAPASLCTSMTNIYLKHTRKWVLNIAVVSPCKAVYPQLTGAKGSNIS